MTKEYKLLISINFPLISLDDKLIANALIGDVYEALEKYVSFTPGDAGFDKGRKQKNDCIRDAILDITTELEQI